MQETENKKNIIGLVGEKLAGKDTTANYLVKKYGAGHFRFTHILDAILEDLDMPISRKNEIDLGLSLRKIFGPHVLVDALGHRIGKFWENLIVVNGIRMDELDVVKGWDAKIIYITAPVELRFARYNTRHEKDDDGVMDINAFKIQETGPTEAAIPDLGKRADFRIDNVGSLDELYKKVDEIVNSLKS